VKRIKDMVDRLKKAYPKHNASCHVELRSWDKPNFWLCIFRDNEDNFVYAENHNSLKELFDQAEILIKQAKDVKEDKIEPNNKPA
jgi:hypothetical protein